MKYTWEYSENEEYWTKDVFDSVEDCILDAKENYGIEPGETIAIGKPIHWEPYVNVYTILDQLEENAYEECGEVAENWYAYDYKSEEGRKSLDELSDKLTEIVKQWLKDNGTYPTFYKIENVKTVEVE